MRSFATLPTLALLLAVWVGGAAAQQASAPAAGASSGKFALSSTAFAAGGEIPREESCKGGDTSPALAWSGAPAKTVSFALIMDDPDAPGGDWVHWVMWNIPSSSTSLTEGMAKREQLEDGIRQGHNSFRKTGYNGPCPPGGQTHHYVFHLYALDGNLELAPNASRPDLEAAMQGHILWQTEYTGTFHK
jgi:hypothetical protein